MTRIDIRFPFPDAERPDKGNESIRLLFGRELARIVPPHCPRTRETQTPGPGNCFSGQAGFQSGNSSMSAKPGRHAGLRAASQDPEKPNPEQPHPRQSVVVHLTRASCSVGRAYLLGHADDRLGTGLGASRFDGSEASQHEDERSRRQPGGGCARREG